MTLPDNRIRYPAGLVDFAGEVGLTGQDHDSYPLQNTQARFDWMRLTLIGLLSNQSSVGDEPTQFRQGTTWFDLDGGPDGAMKVRIREGSDGTWTTLADVILLETVDGTVFTLSEFFQQVALENGIGDATLVEADPNSPQLSVTFNSGTGQFIISFDQTEVDHKFIKNSGTKTHAQIDSHIDSTSNPHGVTATQVGKDTAQWNANRILGNTVAGTPLDDEVLRYDNSSSQWIPGKINNDNIESGSITGDNIASGTIENENLAPGTARLKFQLLDAIEGAFTSGEWMAGSEGDMSKTFEIVLSDIISAGGGSGSGFAFSDISMFWVDIEFDISTGGVLPASCQLRQFSDSVVVGSGGSGTGGGPVLESFDTIYEIGSAAGTAPDSITKFRTTILVPRIENSRLRFQLYSDDANFSELKFAVVGIMSYF